MGGVVGVGGGSVSGGALGVSKGVASSRPLSPSALLPLLLRPSGVAPTPLVWSGGATLLLGVLGLGGDGVGGQSVLGSATRVSTGETLVKIPYKRGTLLLAARGRTRYAQHISQKKARTTKLTWEVVEMALE